MDKSLLVVGGTGVISFACVNEAIKQGFKVTCINRGKSKNQKLSSDVEVIKADYRDKLYIESQLKGRHFGAVLDVLCFRKEDIDYSLNLFKDHCDQYLFFSSAEAYNKPKYQNEVYDESAELVNPLWSYSINKAKCEEELKRLAKIYNVKYTIVRPAITYGNTRIPYGVMPPYGYHGTIIKRIENHKPIILWDGGKGIAMITRVEDFARGFVGLLGNPQAMDQEFHICGDTSYTWKEVIDDLGKILSIDPVYVDIPSAYLAKEMPDLSEQILGGRAINQRLDNSKLKKTVPSFKQSISLGEGIKMTVDYYKSNNYLSGIDWQFDTETDRIIRKWCKDRGKDYSKYNLGFVDYLGTATKQDKKKWLRNYNHHDLLMRYNKIKAIATKIFHRMKSW